MVKAVLIASIVIVNVDDSPGSLPLYVLFWNSCKAHMLCFLIHQFRCAQLNVVHVDYKFSAHHIHLDFVSIKGHS